MQIFSTHWLIFCLFQYLSTPESQTLRCDLIRFICGVIHPSNEVLCSDIIPRWAVIGWLLTTCTSNVAASSAKLSLFYDWLFFDPEKDSIMNIGKSCYFKRFQCSINCTFIWFTYYSWWWPEKDGRASKRLYTTIFSQITEDCCA